MSERQESGNKKQLKEQLSLHGEPGWRRPERSSHLAPCASDEEENWGAFYGSDVLPEETEVDPELGVPESGGWPPGQ